MQKELVKAEKKKYSRMRYSIEFLNGKGDEINYIINN